MRKNQMKKEVLENGRVNATFLKTTKLFINEERADQWLLKMEGEYLLKRQPHIKHTLTLDEIDDGIWVNAYHNSY